MNSLCAFRLGDSLGRVPGLGRMYRVVQECSRSPMVKGK